MPLVKTGDLNPHMQKVVTDLNARLKGRTIKFVSYMDSGEFKNPIVVLDDDTVLTTQSDDEGNGPGVLVHYGKDIEELGMWELH